MDKELPTADFVIAELTAPFTYAAGRAGSRFLLGLKEGRILGAGCDACDKVWVPHRSFCPVCFGPTAAPTAVGPGGVVETFTVLWRPGGHQPPRPSPAPLIYGLIRLHGADTLFVHLIGDIAPAQMRPGLAVEPVFAAAPTTPLLAISHFRPA